MKRLGTGFTNSVLRPRASKKSKITTTPWPRGTNPKLIKKTLPISLTDELPTSRAAFLVARVARQSEHPEMAWEFAKANIKTLLAKTDAVGANSYVPSLFTFFSDDPRADELKTYANKNLPPASAPDVAKVIDEIQFRAEFKDASPLNSTLVHRGN